MRAFALFFFALLNPALTLAGERAEMSGHGIVQDV